MNKDKSIYIKMTVAAIAIIVLILLLHAYQPLPVLPLTAACMKSVRIACNSASAVL
jgi:hypothetical protein